MATPLNPENVSDLIDHVLKSKDPATVGLRRILRKRKDLTDDFPLHSATFDEFDDPNAPRKILNDDEQHILQLERKVYELQKQLKNAEVQSKIMEQEAYRKGIAEGSKQGAEKGMASAKKQYEQKIDSLQEKIAYYIQTLEHSKQEMYANAERMLLQLCRAMVQKIISAEVSIRDDIILGVIKKALSYIADRERLVIRVSPNEMENVSGRKEFWMPIGQRVDHVTIEPDERIEKGGCILESNSGVVDARLGVQFKEMAELLNNVWENIHNRDVNEHCK